METQGRGSVLAAKTVQTQGGVSVLAAKAVEHKAEAVSHRGSTGGGNTDCEHAGPAEPSLDSPEGKGAALATQAVETQDEASTFAAEAVETQGKDSALATQAAETQGKGSVLPGRPPSRRGSGWRRSHRRTPRGRGRFECGTCRRRQWKVKERQCRGSGRSRKGSEKAVECEGKAVRRRWKVNERQRTGRRLRKDSDRDGAVACQGKAVKVKERQWKGSDRSRKGSGKAVECQGKAARKQWKAKERHQPNSAAIPNGPAT